MPVWPDLWANEPNWFVLLLLGALLPLAISGIYSLTKAIIVRSSKPDILEGLWYCRNSSSKDGKPYITEEVWVISRSFSGSLKVDVRNKDNKSFGYAGDISREGGHLIVQYWGLNHDETVSMRIQSPITPTTTILNGFWIGTDYDGKLCSGLVTLARTGFDEWNAEQQWTCTFQIVGHTTSLTY